MNKESSKCVKDGTFGAGAIVEIKDGKATITITATCGLEPGQSIPLKNGSSILQIKGGGGPFETLSGHGII